MCGTYESVQIQQLTQTINHAKPLMPVHIISETWCAKVCWSWKQSSFRVSVHIIHETCNVSRKEGNSRRGYRNRALIDTKDSYPNANFANISRLLTSWASFVLRSGHAHFGERSVFPKWVIVRLSLVYAIIAILTDQSTCLDIPPRGLHDLHVSYLRFGNYMHRHHEVSSREIFAKFAVG